MLKMVINLLILLHNISVHPLPLDRFKDFLKMIFTYVLWGGFSCYKPRVVHFWAKIPADEAAKYPGTETSAQGQIDDFRCTLLGVLPLNLKVDAALMCDRVPEKSV